MNLRICALVDATVGISYTICLHFFSVDVIKIQDFKELLCVSEICVVLLKIHCDICGLLYNKIKNNIIHQDCTRL